MSYDFNIINAAAVDNFDAKEALSTRPFVAREQKDNANANNNQMLRHEIEADTYVPGPGLVTAINTAIAVGLPLILTGEPGTGKTQAAYYIAKQLKLGKVLEFAVRSTSAARDLKYDYDAVRYLAITTRQSTGELPSRKRFVSPGPLWEAIVSPSPRVLLIDEIDKAPRDFPNDLLRELDQWSIVFEDIPELPEIKGNPENRPIVIITSNGERPLPDAFLRRCVFWTIKLTPELLRDAVRRRAQKHQSYLPEEVQEWAIKTVLEIRDQALQKKPALAELITWLDLLDAREVRDIPAGIPLPGLSCLAKTPEDLKVIEGYFTERSRSSS